MKARLAAHWWIFFVRGVIAFAAGVLALLFPGAAVYSIAVLFGAYALIDGLFAVWSAARMNHRDGRWIWLAVEGALGLIAGFVTFVAPGITALTLALLLGAWAVTSGAIAIGSAATMRRWIPGEFWLLATAVCSIVFGVAAFLDLSVAFLALAALFGFYAIAAGVTLIALSLRLRAMRSTAPARAPSI